MVRVLFIGLALVALSLAILWWVRRHGTGRGMIPALILGVGGLLVGVGAVGLMVWAHNSTSDSQLARALVWGESAFGDQDRFPSRSIGASDDPLVFAESDASLVSGYAIDGVALASVLAASKTTAFVVVHGDMLLYEGYFNGSSRDAQQTSFSVAKSFVATLVGIALDEGLIADLQDPITNYLPELGARDERFASITLHHLITMSSGLSFEEGASPWADPANTYHGTDLRAAALRIPTVERAPGETFDYNDWNVILLGMVLERVAEMPVSEYLQTRLWAPMGAEGDGSWSLDSRKHSFEKMFVGVNGRAIDFAKLGWLYANDGRSRDVQVLSAEFVEDATRRDTTSDPSAEYQYLWWLDLDRASFYANGDHGQFIYVDPAADVIIVRHGRGPADVDWVDLMGDLVDWLEPQLAEADS